MGMPQGNDKGSQNYFKFLAQVAKSGTLTAEHIHVAKENQ